ncbi:unnamed protein product, partial [Brenthis ino]
MYVPKVHDHARTMYAREDGGRHSILILCPVRETYLQLVNNIMYNDIRRYSPTWRDASRAPAVNRASERAL